MPQADSVHSTPPLNTSENNPSRRGFLTQAALVAAGGAAAGVAIPLPGSAQAAERVPDPILAAIERHRIAYKEWGNSFGEDEIEAAVPKERRRSDLVGALHGDPDWRVQDDDPRWIAHIETACRVSAEHDNSALALVSCDVLTIAGAVALLEYVAEVEAKDPEAWPDLADDNEKRRTWHFFMMGQVADALKRVLA